MTDMLNNKVALVTGARGGIGRAICERFSREGARVISCDLNPSGSLNSSLNEYSNQADTFIQMDITNEQSVIHAMNQVNEQYGMLHIVVNAAGIEIEESIENTTLEQWNRTLAVNSTGTFLTSKYALPLLRQSINHSKVGASVINFGSYDGFIADPQLAAYCASKGAVHALTKAMACDHGPEGIRVNAVCPGYVNTPMLQRFFEGEGSGGNGGDINSLQQAVRDVHPLRTYGEPEDIANMVNWLASDESRYASGQLFIIDGGLSAQVQQMKL